MLLWATGSEVLADRGLPTIKSRAISFPLKASGLMPNTTYGIYVNGHDLGWATKPNGKNLGDPIVSDSGGRVSLTLLYEAKYQTGIVVTGPAPKTVSSSLSVELRPAQGKSVFYFIPVTSRASF